MQKNCLEINKKRKLSGTQINNAPTVEKSESFIKKHKFAEELNDTTACEDEDPLELANYKEIEVKDELFDESDEYFVVEKDSSFEDVKTDIEFIKIEVVEDETESSNVEETSIENIQQLIRKQQTPTFHSLPIIIKKRREQNSQRIFQYILESPSSKLLLSYKEFASIELNMPYNNSMNEQQLAVITGMTKDILNACEKCLENTLYKEDKISNTKDMPQKIILALMKLKSNVSCRVLERVLGLEQNTCSKIFYSALELLSLALKFAICWFTEKELQDHKAKCFIEIYSCRIRVILHELEFTVDKCQKSNCNINMCKEYKKFNSVKVIVGLSPIGHIFSFVSKIYNSKVSIEYVLKTERLFSHLCYNDDIVVVPVHFFTKELNKIAQKEKVTLSRVDLLKNEAMLNYINQTVQKLEEFEIIKCKKVSTHLVPYIGKAVHVICSVLNLKSEAESTGEVS